MRYGGIVRCPFCGGEGLKTTNSRVIMGNLWCVRRRRHCIRCKRSFQTFEILDEDYQHLEKYAVILEGLRGLLEPVRTDLLSAPGVDPQRSVVQPDGKGKGK